MAAIVMELLMEINQVARTLPHGAKSDYIRQAAERIGVSYPTLYRKLNEFGVGKERKKRADSGQITISREDAQLVSAVLMESMRRNNKRLMSIQQAMDILIANGRIRAGQVVEETGEFIRTSPSTMARALRHYKLHPDQLLQPAPVTELASLHPNHVWAGDASLCVLYYLRREADAGRFMGGVLVARGDEVRLLDVVEHEVALPRLAPEALVRRIGLHDRLGPVRTVAGLDVGFEQDETVVRAAVAAGTLDPARLDRWRKLADENRANTPVMTGSIAEKMSSWVTKLISTSSW